MVISPERLVEMADVSHFETRTAYNSAISPFMMLTLT